MSRSAVLTGRIDARDRARLRGRLDRPASAGSDPFDEIRAWLESSNYGDRSRDEIMHLDLDELLRETGNIDLPADERLRQLAMFVEPMHETVTPDALDRIYAPTPATDAPRGR